MSKSNAGPVRRIRIQFSEGKWSIAKERVVSRMVVPSSQSLPKIAGKEIGSGFWFEVNNSKGELIYRNIIRDPLKEVVEVANEDGTFSQVPIGKKEIIFEVLIPEKPENAKISFFGAKFNEEEKRAITQKIAELELRTIDTLDKNKTDL